MWSEPKFTGLRSLESSQAEEFYVPICHYHKVDLISTLLDSLIVQNAPRALAGARRRSAPLAHIENEWLPATLTLSPPVVWTDSKDFLKLESIWLDKICVV